MGMITLELNEDEARLIRHALGKAIEEGSLAETDLQITADAIRERITEALAQIEK